VKDKTVLHPISSLCLSQNQLLLHCSKNVVSFFPSCIFHLLTPSLLFPFIQVSCFLQLCFILSSSVNMGLCFSAKVKAENPYKNTGMFFRAMMVSEHLHDLLCHLLWGSAIIHRLYPHTKPNSTEWDRCVKKSHQLRDGLKMCIYKWEQSSLYKLIL
jgi:hypothetical protein